MSVRVLSIAFAFLLLIGAGGGATSNSNSEASMNIRERARQDIQKMGRKMLAYMEEKYGESFTLVENDTSMATMYSESHPHDLLKVTYFPVDKNYPLRDNYAGIFIRESLSAKAREYVDRYFPENLTIARVRQPSFHPSLGKDATYESFVELHGWSRIALTVYVADIPMEEHSQKLIDLAAALAEDGYLCTVYARFVYPEMVERLREPDIQYEIDKDLVSRIPWYHETASLSVEKTDDGYAIDESAIKYNELYTNRRPE